MNKLKGDILALLMLENLFRSVLKPVRLPSTLANPIGKLVGYKWDAPAPVIQKLPSYRRPRIHRTKRQVRQQKAKA